MTSNSLYHELTKTVNLSGFFVTNFEAYEDRVRFYLERRNHVARCSKCGLYCGDFHDSKERVLRDHDWGERSVYLVVRRVRVRCPDCKVRVEKLPFASISGTLTSRFEESLVQQARVMTRADVAQLYKLSEDTIGRLEWKALQSFLPTARSLQGLRLLRVDEIAKRKGHNYVTVIINAETGRVVWVADGRKADDLQPFFEALGSRRSLVEAVCLDMSRSYISAFQQGCLRAKLVFDRFHVVKHLNETLEKIRKSEKVQAPASEEALWRHTRYLLGKTKSSLTPKQQERLRSLLQKNATIATVYNLSTGFSKIWEVPTLRGAKISLTRWLQRANKIEHEAMESFCKLVENHREGILNYQLYPLTNGPQEGFNNKLNVLRRRAYGYRNVDWFSLKIFQASA